MATESEPEFSMAIDGVDSEATNHPPVAEFRHIHHHAGKVFCSTATSNGYSDLSDDDEGHDPPQRKRPPKSPAKTASQPTPASDKPSKRERVPTITIKWEVTRVRAEMSVANMKPASYLLQQIKGATVVKIATVAEYRVFLSRCKERKIPHFTHQVDAEKPTRIVLLGLYDMPVEEIREALAIHSVVPVDIKPMRIRHSRFLEHNNFILYFKKGTMTTAKLRDIEGINSIRVRWAYYDAKRHGPTQCRRCQEWGHGSSHCLIAPACVKCAGDHETSACTLAEKGAKVPDANLKCANCKQSHTANYGGCPTRKEFIASRPQKKQPKSNYRHGGQHKRFTPQYQDKQRWPELPKNLNQQPRPQPGPPPHHQPRPQPGPPPHHQPRPQPGPAPRQPQYQGSTPVHQFNKSKNVQSNNVPIDETPFTREELIQVFQEIMPIVNSGKTRSEQLCMLIDLAYKHNCTPLRG
jgi:hypothetical protein